MRHSYSEDINLGKNYFPFLNLPFNFVGVTENNEICILVWDNLTIGQGPD